MYLNIQNIFGTVTCIQECLLLYFMLYEGGDTVYKDFNEGETYYTILKS